MQLHRLQYKTSPIFLGLPQEKLNDGRIEEWEIREVAESTEQVEEGIPIRSYCLILEKEVKRLESRRKQEEKILHFQEQASKLIHELHLIWPFIYGSIPVVSPRIMESRNVPSNWSSNSGELLNEIYPIVSPYRGTLTIERTEWTILPYMPLPKLLNTYTAYKNANAAIKTLVELYYDACDSNDHAKLFLLAKALELVRAILPGKSDKERMSGLDSTVTSTLSKDFSWLFMIANTRADIRHIVQRPDNITLHPLLTLEEKFEFIRNASRVVRGVVCQKLQITYTHCDDERFNIVNLINI